MAPAPRALNAQREAGPEPTLDDYLARVTALIGPIAKTDLAELLEGGLTVPGSGAFDTCILRTATQIPLFDMGFDLKSTVGTDQVIRGIVAGSTAAKAGIRDGDRIVRPIQLDRMQDDPTKPVTLKLSRDGKPFDATYAPTGRLVDGYLWVSDNRRKACTAAK